MLALCAAIGCLSCATTEKIYDDLGMIKARHGCLGVEIHQESSLCIDTVYITVRIVW
jgi:hypothetical protein